MHEHANAKFVARNLLAGVVALSVKASQLISPHQFARQIVFV
jgi:hypothetical protein